MKIVAMTNPTGMPVSYEFHGEFKYRDCTWQNKNNIITLMFTYMLKTLFLPKSATFVLN